MSDGVRETRIKKDEIIGKAMALIAAHGAKQLPFIVMAVDPKDGPGHETLEVFISSNTPLLSEPMVKVLLISSMAKLSAQICTGMLNSAIAELTKIDEEDDPNFI